MLITERHLENDTCPSSVYLQRSSLISFVLVFICELHQFVNQLHSETLNTRFLVISAPREQSRGQRSRIHPAAHLCVKNIQRKMSKRITEDNSHTAPSIKTEASATQLETAASSHCDPEEKHNRR